MVSLALILSFRDASFSSSCWSDKGRGLFRVGQSREGVLTQQPSGQNIALSVVLEKNTTYALYHKHMCTERECMYCMCAAVWLYNLTTVSKGSGLHLLLGLLVTEVTVAMGSWKWMKGYSCVPFYMWLLAHFIQSGWQHIQIYCCVLVRLTAEGGGEVTVWMHLHLCRVDTHTHTHTKTPTHSWYKSMVPF